MRFQLNFKKYNKKKRKKKGENYVVLNGIKRVKFGNELRCLYKIFFGL